MPARDAVDAVLGGQGVEIVETHGSRVFLHPEDVYKVRKAVRFPFLDYTTLELRKKACEEELRINRRTAPQVYLATRPVVRTAEGELALLEGDADIPEGAQVLEWVVHMRRLPDDWRADHLLERGELDREAMGRVARFLADFHRGADCDVDPAGAGSAAVLRANVLENLDSLEPHARSILGHEATRRLRECHLAMLEQVEPVLATRKAAGRVIDGHGDFRLEHVYLEGDRVTVLDAIEFDRDFRVADVCADVAFMVMDLDSRGRTDLGETFLAAYAHESGDHDIYALVDFYLSYWALVRAKVDAVRAQQVEGGQQTMTLMESCARRLYLASHLVDGAQRSPTIFAVMGLIASGKSRVARALGTTLAAPVVSSDRLRKQLAQRAPTDNLGSEPYQGEYTEDKTRAVYAELLRRAEVVASSGRPVVLDASFQDIDARRHVAELASRLGVPHLFLECRAPRREIEARLQRRTGRDHDSDARAPLLEQFQSQFPPWDESLGADHVIIDTSQPRAQVDQLVLQHARSVRRASRQSLRVSIGRGAST